uniref:Dickkopf WNT signaling pathway inhibitor 4 n=2 Tax=Bos TaxID=9903 RepID=A0A8B9WYI4_BOSMU
MVVVVLLGLGWLCAPLGALVLDSNYIKSSSGAQRARKGSQCVSDKDCSARKFCLQRYDEKPFCATCRGPRRRCQLSTMCCPGTLCMNNFCTPVEQAAKGPEKGTDDKDDIDTEETIEHPMQGNSNTTKPQPRKRHRGERCLRDFNCGPGLCCTHHYRTKICKPVLLEGHVCSRRGHNNTHVVDIFQRCHCAPGLVCQSQAAQDPVHTQLHMCQKARLQ